MRKKIREYIINEVLTIESIDDELVYAFADKLAHHSGKIYVFGNGGSSATASHMCCDLNKGVYEYTGKSLGIECLSDNIPTLTAFANDDSYNNVFMDQLKMKDLTQDDIVIAISGSGNSENVIKAIEYASSKKCETISLTGFNGGRLKPISSFNLNVPNYDIRIVEDAHMMITHILKSVVVDILLS